MFTRSSSLLFGAALIAAALTPSVKADQWDKKTIITINEPVQMPSCCTLSYCNPELMFWRWWILSPIAILFASLSKIKRPWLRPYLPSRTIACNPPTRARSGSGRLLSGQPRAMRAWFYPGDNFGQEFAYPKTKSVEIAKVAHAPVPAVVVETETEAELKTAPVVVVDEKGEEKPVEVVVAKAEPPVQPAPEPRATTLVYEAPAPAKLPDTASPYPLFGLIGLGSIIASKLISRFSKRA